jgi:hypothetical protein
MGLGILDNIGGILQGAGAGGGSAFDVGVQVPSADVNAVLYVDSSGNLATSSDDGAIGATGVNLGYLGYREHIADHAYLGHVDANTSSTVFQIDMRQSGDLVLKAPVASGAVTIIGGISGTGTISLLVNASTSRFVVNNTGIGFFGTTPAARSTGWTTFTNLTTDKTCDANATTVDELADILGTLIEYLKLIGLIST